MQRRPIRRDSAGDPPLSALLVFLSLVSAILFLAMDVPLKEQQVNITDEHQEIRGDVDSVEDAEQAGVVERIFADTYCLLSLGLAELFTDICQVGLIGQAITGALSNIEILQRFTGGLSSFVSLLGDLATLNIPGAPTWVRFALGTPIVGIISYTVILVVRGS